jgi:hypothetical protein
MSSMMRTHRKPHTERAAFRLRISDEMSLWNSIRSLLSGWTASEIGWGLSLAGGMLIGTAVIGGLVMLYLPPNYFSRPRSTWSEQRPWLYWAIVIGKNLLGVVLIVLGIVMLVLPGQGLLTILIGLMLLSVPGKRKLTAGLIRRTGMLNSVNRWRAKFGQPPLALPNKK